MTEGIAADSGQNLPAAVVGEMRFESRDVGAYFRDAIGELIEDIGDAARGFGWAITVFRSGEAITVAAGSAATQAVDEAQGPFEDGPARTAVRSGEFVLVADTGLERRWPGYASAAAAAGIRSLLSVPLLPTGVFGAVVNLYALSPHVFTSADITAAVKFARHTSRSLQLAQHLARTAEKGAELSSAQLSRALAGLALRTLVREYGFSSEAALEYLRRVAGNFSVGPLEGSLLVLITGSGQDRSGDAAESVSADGALG
jgi:GAF domain-containing protein